MRICDWSSDVCSSDLYRLHLQRRRGRGWPGDDQCGRFSLCADPALQPHPHSDCVRMMNDTPTSGPKIELKGLVKRFGRKTVLDGIDLQVNSGESLVVIGGSGTGKSVMLKCILGLLRPDAGQILVDGEDVTRLKGRDLQRVRAKFGMLFQSGALFDSLPVWRNVTFALRQGHVSQSSEMRRIALENLKMVGLGADEIGRAHV